MYKTITAQYPGRCGRCKGEFQPGEKIRYGGRGRTYHMSRVCPASEWFNVEPAPRKNGRAFGFNVTAM